MNHVTNVLNYFNPLTKKFDSVWETFDSCLTFREQLWTITATALAALISLPILGLGGLAVFRAMVNHFVPLNTNEFSDTPSGRAAGITHDLGMRNLKAMSEDEFVDAAKLLFKDESSAEEDLDPAVEPRLKGLYKKYKNGRILFNALKKVGSFSERLELVKQAQNLNSDINSPQEFSKLLKFLYEIRDQWEVAIPRMEIFGRGISKATELEQIHKAFDDLPEEDENELVLASKMILDNFKSPLERVRCLKVLQVYIPEGQRIGLVQKFSFLLQTVTSATKLAEVLPMISKATPDKQGALETLLMLLSSDEDDGTLLEKGLLCVDQLPDSVSVELLDNISNCLHGIGEENLLPVIQIVNHVASLPADKRVDVVAAAMTHINPRMDPVERRLIMSALCDLEGDLNEVDHHELKELVERKKLIIEFFGSLENTVEKQEIMEEIQRIPEEQRDLLFSKISPLMPQIGSAAQFKELIKGLKMVAPRLWEVAVSRLDVNDIHFNWITVVNAAFRDDINARNDTKDYLVQLLRTETNREVALGIARLIQANQVLFGVAQNEQDELYMLLLSLIPPEVGHFVGPHDLYNNLLIWDRTIETPPVEIPEKRISGIKVRLNQPHFEKAARETKKLTFGDLQPPMTKSKLDQLFQNFDKRMARLGLTERNKAWVDGVSNCLVVGYGGDLRDRPSPAAVEQAYNSTRNTFLGSAYISDTLNLRGENESRIVPTGYLHMHAVLKYIMDCSTDINPATGLSEQEETMLRMISSIQNCSTGKSEGFAAFYMQLPSEAQIHGIAGATTKEEKAVVYLHSILQSILGDYLTHLGPMAKELIGRDSDGQFVHTSKYLKNLIAKRVGLDWSISFDAYPGCIDGTLKNRSLDDVLRIFYNHFTPSVLVEKVLRKINQDNIPNLEEVGRIESELSIAEREIEEAMKKGELPLLEADLKDKQKRSSELMNERRSLMVEVQKLKRIEEDQGLSELQLGDQKRLNERKKQAIDEYNHLQNEIKLARSIFAEEKSRQGIDRLEEKKDEIEERLVAAQLKASEKLNQLTSLFGEESREGCLVTEGTSGMLFKFNEKGITKLLIHAGYLEAI